MSTSLLPPPRSPARSEFLTDEAAAFDELSGEVPTTSRRGLTAVQFAAIAGFCLLFLYHNYLPLFHSDLCGHVSYGDWILQHRQLPTEDPFTPLAEGVPVVATAWLSQVLFALTARIGDVEWLAHLFALTVLATHVVLLRAYMKRGATLPVAMFAVTTAFVIAWSRHAVQRPEVFGAVCFAGLLWLMADEESRRAKWWKTFALLPLFTAWGNLHGSFIMGYAFLACLFVGRGCDIVIRQGLRGLFQNETGLNRLLVGIELALLGTMLNPCGMDLLVYALAFPGHPNLQTVLEWFPLEMKSLEGIPMAASWILTAVVLRHSQRRMTGAEVLLLVVFNAAVCVRVRMIAWYAPVLLWALAPHLNDIAERWSVSIPNTLKTWWITLKTPSPRWIALAVFAVWMTFALSPISRPILGGKPRPPRQVFSHDTPLGVTAYLREHPPTGLVAAPQWWGDWLSRHTNGGWHVMATTNAIHLLPQQVWNDYLAISVAEGGLERRLDRYRINTVIVGKALQPELERTMARLPGWKTVYEDDVGVIVVRTRSQTESAKPVQPEIGG